MPGASLAVAWRTEVIWGLRDFELRFGRKSEGLWLPECAADSASLAPVEIHMAYRFHFTRVNGKGIIKQD